MNRSFMSYPVVKAVILLIGVGTVLEGTDIRPHIAEDVRSRIKVSRRNSQL